MRQENFIAYLKKLKPEDWRVKISTTWTVKDVVAHMVGWEKGDGEVIKKSWETKKPPWFYLTDDFDEFNKKSVEYYRRYTPAQLIVEWEMWREKVHDEITAIGRAKLQSRPELFRWLFEDENSEHRESPTHYEHHYQQIKDALKKV